MDALLRTELLLWLFGSRLGGLEGSVKTRVKAGLPSERW